MPAPQATQANLKRRSYRFTHRIPVVLSAADAPTRFYERGETSDVSSHGCRVRLQRKLDPGQHLRLEVPSTGRQAEARVARVTPDASATAWEVGLELLEPGNIWSLQFSPHVLHWPADLTLPPLPGEPPRPAPAPAPAAAPPPAEKVRELRPPSPEPARTPSQEEWKRQQEQQAKELEARLQAALREATNQLTKNTQFALETAEKTLRELTEAARRDLEQWLDEQRLALEVPFRPLSQGTELAVVEPAIEEFRHRLNEALQALTDQLGKGKPR